MGEADSKLKTRGHFFLISDTWFTAVTYAFTRQASFRALLRLFTLFMPHLSDLHVAPLKFVFNLGAGFGALKTIEFLMNIIISKLNRKYALCDRVTVYHFYGSKICQQDL